MTNTFGVAWQREQHKHSTAIIRLMLEMLKVASLRTLDGKATARLVAN